LFFFSPNQIFLELVGGFMRIIVLANKWWECEAMVAAMLNTSAFPPPLSDGTIAAPWCDTLSSPRSQVTDAYNATSRATFSFKHGTRVIFTVEVWSVSDLLEKTDPSSSSSSAKAAHLSAKLFPATGPRPDLVIAVGTAGTASETPNRSGGVAIGGQVFLHNAHPPNTADANPKSTWSDPRQEKLIPPSIDKHFFEQIAAFDSATALLHFLPLRRGGSTSPIITIGHSDVGLGTLNVTDYNEYKFKDPDTVRAYDAQGHHSTAVSLETTHGLIRLASDPAPFLFVTGITDTFLHFDDQVGTPALADAQNFAAAYNAGITVRYMLAGLLKKKLNL
jgi:hypothetical protein